MLRWIGFSRVSMQRLGSLLATTVAASDSRPTSLEGVGDAAMRMLARPVRLKPDDAHVLEYVHRQRLWERYPKLHGLSKDVESVPEVSINAQDVWLADPELPSSTGAVTSEVVHEPPQLASALQLVRSKNYTRTDRGRVVTILMARHRDALRDGARAPNPFAVPLGAGGVFLYALLDADIDFMRAVYNVALQSHDEGELAFTRAGFAAWLPPALKALSAAWTKKARSGADHNQLHRLRELHDLVSRPRQSGAKWGGGRPPEQTSTVRIEPYVDVGLISKRKRHTYDYFLTADQRSFFTELVEEQDPQAFLDGRLFGAYQRARGHADSAPVEPGEAWQRILDAYGELRNELGYASFREVALLAIARLMDEGDGRYFEIGTGIATVQAERKRSPRTVRLGAARGGGLTYMKVTNEAKVAGDA